MFHRILLRRSTCAAAASVTTTTTTTTITTITNARVRSFGTRGSRGHGWLHHYRAGNKGRHLQGRYHYRDQEKRAAINDSMFDLGTSECYIDLAVEQNEDNNDDDEDEDEASSSSSKSADSESEEKEKDTEDTSPLLASSSSTVAPPIIKHRIHIELASVALPRTCENFLKLIEDGYYDQTQVSRIEKNVGLCLGGAGGGGTTNAGRCHPDVSPHGVFEHESYVLSHVDGGMLTMLSPGVDKNDSQFAILINEAPHLDGRMTAFGRVKKKTKEVSDDDAASSSSSNNTEHLRNIVDSVFTAKGIPLRAISIVGCGVL